MELGNFAGVWQFQQQLKATVRSNCQEIKTEDVVVPDPRIKCIVVQCLDLIRFGRADNPLSVIS